MLRTGVPEALEPMSPSDRKVVHDTVNELEGLETSSEGIERHDAMLSSVRHRPSQPRIRRLFRWKRMTIDPRSRKI